MVRGEGSVDGVGAGGVGGGGGDEGGGAALPYDVRLLGVFHPRGLLLGRDGGEMRDIHGFVGGTPEDAPEETAVRYETDTADNRVITYRLIGHLELQPSRHMQASFPALGRLGDLIARELEGYLREIGASSASIRLIPLIGE